MKILHITDIHLDHLETQTQPVYMAGFGTQATMVNGLIIFAEYYNKRIVDEDIDLVLITGDISTNEHLGPHLEFLKTEIKAPIYFILGNHDYYESDKVIDGDTQSIARAASSDVFNYLTSNKEAVIHIDPITDKTVAFVGSDGWYDGEYAFFSRSDLFMTDFVTIQEFNKIFEMAIKEAMRKGDFYPQATGNIAFSYHLDHGMPYQLQLKFKEVAMHFTQILEGQIQSALKENAEEIVILTHVPPFEFNSQYNGKVSDRDWMPYFSSKYCGDLILKYAESLPNIKFTVLCGHSHADVTNQVRDNLVCYTTAAEYRQVYAGRVLEF